MGGIGKKLSFFHAVPFMGGMQYDKDRIFWRRPWVHQAFEKLKNDAEIEIAFALVRYDRRYYSSKDFSHYG